MSSLRDLLPSPRPDLVPVEIAAFLFLAALIFLIWRSLASGRTFRASHLKDLTAAFAIEIAKRVKGEEFLVGILLKERHHTSLRHEREQQIQLGFNAAGLGTWTWKRAQGEVISDVNLRELYGFSPAESVTRIEQFYQRIHPDDLASLQHALNVPFEDGPDFNLEFRCVHPDGSIHWLSARGTVLRDDAGQPVSMTGININIDAQKAAAFELQESERLFRTLANSVPQLTWMSHADGNRFWCSERWYAYTGTSPEQNSGFGWQSLIHPQQLPALLEKWRACTISGQPFSFEMGSRAPMEITAPS